MKVYDNKIVWHNIILQETDREPICLHISFVDLYKMKEVKL